MYAFFAPSLKSPRIRASLAGLSVVLTTGVIGATASGAYADAGADESDELRRRPRGERRHGLRHLPGQPRRGHVRLLE